MSDPEALFSRLEPWKHGILSNHKSLPYSGQAFRCPNQTSISVPQHRIKLPTRDASAYSCRVLCGVASVDQHILISKNTIICDMNI